MLRQSVAMGILWVYGLRLFQVLKCGRTDIRELISQPARARLVSFEE